MGRLSYLVAGLALPGLLFYLFCWRLPATRPVALPPLPPREQLALLPLDSRPVCTSLPQALGALAGSKVILPPKEALDNYKQPSQQEKLRQWLEEVLPSCQGALLSSDNYLLGGLSSARSRQPTPAAAQAFFRQLQAYGALCPDLGVFAIVPRLWLPDQPPASWYGYSLYRYNQEAAAAGLGSFTAAQALAERRENLPAPILAAYLDLYQANRAFNRAFLSQDSGPGLRLLGQDDSEPLSLANAGLEQAAALLAASPRKQAALTYGADEVAALLLARRYLAGRRPKVYLRYAHPSLPYLYLPYMALTVSGSLADKMALLGLEEAASLEEADFCLYVSCGHQGYSPGPRQVAEVAQLLQGPCPLALLDLSADYEREQLLLPLLLKEELPLLRLGAYAGWNTFSNSAGSALAQAAVFTLRRREVPPADLPRLYAQNALFLCQRFLDDYAYQKLLHPQLRQELEVMGLEPGGLQPRERAYAQRQADAFVRRQARELLHYCLGRHSFYQDAQGAYYLRELEAGARLPWPRIFEADIQVEARFGLGEREGG